MARNDVFLFFSGVLDFRFAFVYPLVHTLTAKTFLVPWGGCGVSRGSFVSPMCYRCNAHVDLRMAACGNVLVSSSTV